MYLLFSGLLFILLAIVPSAQAQAQAGDDEEAYRKNNIEFYDGADNADSCITGSADTAGITPGKVYILGDSIVNGAENGDYLRAEFAGAWNAGEKGTSSDSINGEDDRHISAAVGEIDKDSSLVKESVAIIIALGTNDSGSNFSSTISETISAVRSHNESAPIFWVDIADTTKDTSPGNSAIHSMSMTPGEEYSVIPWFTKVSPELNAVSAKGAVDTHGYLGDGIHPNSTGYPVYSQLLFNSVSKHQVAVEESSTGKIVLRGENNSEKVFNFFRTQGLSAVQSAAIVGNYMVETWATMDPAIKQGSKIGGKIQTFSNISEVEDSNGTRGYGLAQWTHDSRQTAWVEFVREKGHDIVDLGSQLEWTWHELTTGDPGSGYGHFIKEEDLRQAAWIFVSFYERPGSVSSDGRIPTLTQPNPSSTEPAKGTKAHKQWELDTTAKKSLDSRVGYAQEAYDSYKNNPIYDINAIDNCITGLGDSDFSASGIRIDGSPDGLHKESNCFGEFTPGAEMLRGFVLDTWKPPVTSVGGYSCRSVNNCDADERDDEGHCTTTPTSIHGMGRAIDIMINALDPAEVIIGDEIRNWLINNSSETGVQRIIWNGHSWRSDKDGWGVYSGSNAHTNHLHVEINEDGAEMTLPWYAGR